MGVFERSSMGRGGAPIEATLVPTRFMLLTAQTIVTIMLFYTKDQNIYASLADNYSQAEYDEQDDQMKTMLGFSIVCLFMNFVGLITGVTMFSHQLNVFHISMHFFGASFLSFATTDNWDTSSLWAISALCCFLPGIIEVTAIVSICCCRTSRY